MAANESIDYILRNMGFENQDLIEARRMFAHPYKNKFLKSLNFEESIPKTYQKIADNIPEDEKENFFSLRTAQGMVNFLGGKEKSINISQGMTEVHHPLVLLKEHYEELKLKLEKGQIIYEKDVENSQAKEKHSEEMITTLKESITNLKATIRLFTRLGVILLIAVIILGVRDWIELLKN